MRIILRILVVLLAILSGVALYLGIKLFDQREQIKGRLSLLEQSTADLSKQIEIETPPDLAMRNLAKVNIDPRDIKQYYAIDPQTRKPKTDTDSKTGRKVFVSDGPGTMKPVLRSLLERAKKQTETLDQTRVALQEVRDTLKRSQDKVADVRSKNASLEAKLEQANEDSARLREEDILNKTTIDAKEAETLTLKTQVEDQKTRIQKQEEQMFLQKNTIVAIEKRNSDLQDRIRKIEVDKGGGVSHNIPHGLKGTIAKVNPERSFVVINVNPDTKLAPDITLVVRREEKLVGKVAVQQIKPEQNLAIAEIIWAWLRLPIQKGDVVEYLGE